MCEKERRKLHSKGIFTVTQLSYTFRPRWRPKRMRDKQEKYHHSLKALAIREKKIRLIPSRSLGELTCQSRLTCCVREVFSGGTHNRGAKGSIVLPTKNVSQVLERI